MNRTQAVRICSIISLENKVYSGVSQRSHLGPLLLIGYYIRGKRIKYMI